MRPVPRPLADPLLKHFEQGPRGGFAVVPYRDGPGYWTTAYGHRLSPADPLFKTTVDQALADKLLHQDSDAVAAFLNLSLGDQVLRLTDAQYAALISFTFNEGAQRFAGSTLHAVIVAGHFQLAGDQFDRWVYDHIDGKAVVEGGLVRRRAAERALWEGRGWSAPS